ncbi:MAG: ABC transporter ATP-binding protein [Candidatus Saccharibacteria bacterium]|nr:ABC transporter ATP-binding protein [Candidatus Saccharibacteria bacterium]
MQPPDTNTVPTTTPPQPERPVLITATDLTKSYRLGRQHITAVRDVSLKIYRGEIVALTGTSGSGKSTLLHLLGGLDKPSTGSVCIDGTDINKLRDRKLSMFRNQTIGFVFQSFYLQPFLTLRRNIEVASMPQRMKRAERKQRIEELARQVGLYDRLDHRPRELSGGQIQRAAIARALLNRPAIILADEPTGNLDSHNSQEIMTLFKHIRDTYQTTIIIATHDHALATQADRIITLQDGGII